MMKRIKKVIFTLFLPLMAIGCSAQNDQEKESKLKILSTTAQVHDLAAYIGGKRVEAKVLIRGDLDPHSYEIVKGDGEKLENSHVIFYNGLGLEHGASLSSYLSSSNKSVAVGNEIQRLYPQLILKREGQIDPHIWMDISLWEKAIAPIVKTLSEKDPQGAEYYKLRGEDLSLKMLQAHKQLYQRLQEIPEERRYLVTSHDAFRYFTRSYLSIPEEPNWEERFAAPEGLSPEGQLNPVDIQNIIVFLQKKNLHVIFPESNVSRDAIRKIASAGKELGLEVRICSEALYGDAMGGFSYLEMMKKNGETLRNCL
jgi:manganese/zinc/iron transport system substrate-binding protein